MRKNDARRTALVDAAIEVLAAAGARGLTFRAVDSEAGVPNGTASNYFASRDDLFTQIGGRVYDRLLPDEATVAGTLEGPRTTERYTEIMRELVDRVTAFGSGQLALLELRLESARRPELQRVLTARIRRDLNENQANHAASGLPGDEQSVLILYLALNWLILERLTLPDLLSTSEVDAVVEELVRRALAV